MSRMIIINLIYITLKNLQAISQANFSYRTTAISLLLTVSKKQLWYLNNAAKHVDEGS